MKSGTKKQRQEALRWLNEKSSGANGSYEIAQYFINTLSWTRLIDAHETLKERL